MKVQIIKIIIYLLILSTISCNFFNPNKASNPVKIISEDEAKSIIIENILNDDMYRQYFILDSPNFDERVRAISWGKTVLVHRIPNEKYKMYKPRVGYYYVLSGVMPDDQILAMQIVDAQTGENLHGQRFMDEDCDVLRIVTPIECMEYAGTYLQGNLKCEAIYYFDGTQETFYEHLTWRYLVQPVNSDAISRGFTGTDYVLIDPYVQNFKTDNTLKSTNGFLSRVGYYHRAFRFNLTKGEDEKKMAPID